MSNLRSFGAQNLEDRPSPLKGSESSIFGAIIFFYGSGTVTEKVV